MNKLIIPATLERCRQAIPWLDDPARAYKAELARRARHLLTFQYLVDTHFKPRHLGSVDARPERPP